MKIELKFGMTSIFRSKKYMRILTFLLLFFSFICIGCKNDQGKEDAKIEFKDSQKKSSVHINWPKPVMAGDSLDLTLTYDLKLDSVKMNPEDHRITGLIISKEYISTDRFQKLIDSFEVKKMQRMGMGLWDLTNKDSLNFRYKFDNPGMKHLTMAIFDQIYKPDSTVSKNNEKMIQHVSYFDVYISVFE